MEDASAVRFAERFRGRLDVYARMWHQPQRGTGYSPVHAPLDAEVARAHLEGRSTVGTYLVRSDDSVRHGVIDLDATRGALASAHRDRGAAKALRDAIHSSGLELRHAMEEAGWAPMLVDSGYKGRHLWCFLGEPAPARQVRVALRSAVAPVSLDPRLRIEVFPKQDKVRKGGLGNLVKLPLGVHLRTGRISRILDGAGQPVADGLSQLLAWPTSTVPEVVLDTGPEEPPPPDDTRADDTRADDVITGCPVLRTLVEDARRTRILSHDAIVVLNHSLGHLPGGVDLLQQLYAMVPELPEAAVPRGQRRGYPISCDRVRRRVPELLQRVSCDCVFPERAGEYLHPLRHVDQDRDLDHLTRELSALRRRSSELETEVGERLAAEQGSRHVVDGGAWVRSPDGSVAFVPEGE